VKKLDKDIADSPAGNNGIKGKNHHGTDDAPDADDGIDEVIVTQQIKSTYGISPCSAADDHLGNHRRKTHDNHAQYIDEKKDCPAV
jgi:hypothetical protein